MPVIYEGNAGRVFAVPDRVATGLIQIANVTGEGGQLSYLQHNTIITSMGLSTSGNFQFMHTIGGDIYIYVFGDRMGALQINGLSFSDQCPADNGTEFHGVERLIRWYNQNRVAYRRNTVRVIIGRSTVIDGFITSLQVTGEDAGTRSVRFSMGLTMLP